MFWNHIKIALRTILRNRGFSFINIMGLAVGMACCITILLWVQGQLSYDKFHENADLLHRVVLTNEAQDFQGYITPGALADYLRDEFPEIEEASVYREIGSETKIAHGERSFLRAGAFVHPSFLSMFTFPFVNGDAETAFEDPFSIVISEDLATAIFGDIDPMGQPINFDDRAEFTVSGILRDVPVNSHLQFDFLLSYDIAPRWMKVWDNKTLATYVQLHEGTSHPAVTEKIWNVYNDHNPGAYKNFLYLQPVTDTHLNDLGAWWHGDQQVIVYVYILTALAFVVLLIACINFMNLSTARSVTRAREIGVRKVLGSGRLQLVKQFLSESILLSLIGLMLAIGIVELFLPSLNQALGSQLEISYSFEVIIGLIGVALVTGIISGSYPAFYLSSFYPVAILSRRYSISSLFRSNKSGTSSRVAGGSSIRKTLVVLQFALSIVLIISVFALSGQMDYLRGMDVGFDKEQIITIPLYGEMRRHAASVKNEILSHSNIESVSLTFSGQLRWSESCGFDWEGKQPGDEFDMGINRVDYDYQKTFGMELASGRFFSEKFATDATDAVVINEAAAKAMSMTDATGQTVHVPFLNRDCTIIGVLKNFNNESAHKEIRPFALLPTQGFRHMNIRLGPADHRETLNFVEEKMRSFVPDDPFAYSFLSEQIDNLYRSDRKTRELVTYVALVAVFISCLGLFGLASFSVEQRTKEIAVRKVHGATIGRLIALVSREFIVLVSIASLIAWPVAYFATDYWLQNFAYRTQVWWWVYVISGVAALLLALATVSYQSLRAALANPIDSLRHE